MNPLEVTFHVELTHYVEKKTSKGVAKKIITFLPARGMFIGDREILNVERVHWLGQNTFAIHLMPLVQVPRADPNSVTFGDLAAMKKLTEEQTPMLKWEWADETTG